MRVLLQRVSRASVSVDQKIVGKIGKGWLALLGVSRDDTEKDADWLVEKTLGLRLFSNEEGKFDYTVEDVDGGVLVVSQFTLYGDAKKGRRPNFSLAAPPEAANRLYEYFVAKLREKSGLSVETGEFGAMMQVELVNDGPVTLMVDSPN